MFALGIYLGILSYVIFGLGLVGLLYKPAVIFVTTITVIGYLLYSFRGPAGRSTQSARRQSEAFASILLRASLSLTSVTPLYLLAILFLVVQSAINLVGALGPELGFDALWYHLTLPKLYLLSHTIIHIPGGLFYYSDMPKLAEMLYVIGLSFGSEILPKLIHFGFGIFCLIATYKLARKFVAKEIAILAPVILAGNLVFGWESISAYIDLARTFFEILAIWAFVNWNETKKDTWLIESAVFLGLAITTKVLAVGSLFVFIVLIIYVCNQRKLTLPFIFKYLTTYILIVFLIPLPWFIFSYLHTGNPFFPFFSSTYPTYIDINPLRLWALFTNAADPISPVYLAFLPVVILFWKKIHARFHALFLYAGLSLVVWVITPDTGGGRFMLPYLPVLSLVICSIFTIKGYELIKRSLIIFIFLTIIVSIGYRGITNAKFIPALLARETKMQFLSHHLVFSFGDFVDNDGYFKSNIKSTDKVLVYGFHNEYYLDFPYIDSSYVRKGDVFNYIAVQNGQLPKRFQYWNLIYMNPLTHVNMYSAGGLPWSY